MQSLGTQTGAVAGLAGDDVHETFEIFPDTVGISFVIAALKVGDHPFEGFFIKMAVVSLIVEKTDALFAGAIEDHLLHGLGQLIEGGAHIKLVMESERLKQRLIIEAGATVPGYHGALTQGQLRIGNHLLAVEEHTRAEPAAVRAGAVRVVEGKHAWGDFRVGQSAFDTGMTC